MTLVLKVVYETDSEPRDTPWRHYENLDAKIIDFFEGLGMKLYESSFSFDDLTRIHEFEFDKDLNDEMLTFTAVEEESVPTSDTDVFVILPSNADVLASVTP